MWRLYPCVADVPGLLSEFVAAARSCVALLSGHQGSSAKIQKKVLPTPEGAK